MVISIHAAQEGCDANWQPLDSQTLISIHAAQEGCDEVISYPAIATHDISIHAAQEGCDGFVVSVAVGGFDISIHAAQEGCDKIKWNGTAWEYISIHAAQEGCDVVNVYPARGIPDFNPRSPRGLRRGAKMDEVTK